jgi:hypothetical protein
MSIALAGAAVLGLASCGSEPSGPNEVSLLVEPGQMQLYVGQNAPLVSQVVTSKGQVEMPAITYWSNDLTVARVSDAGTVAAVAPGTTLVMARFQTLVDSVRVTVLRDTRADLHLLDIIPSQVAGATEASDIIIPFAAIDGYGLTRCTPATFSLRIDPVIATASNSSSGDVCTITLSPEAEGQGWLVASADGMRDSVLVVVQNGAYRAEFTPEALAAAVAGVTRPLTMRILNAHGVPVAGRAVRFSVYPGTLNQSTSVTDSTGAASVVWTPPTTIYSYGGSARISFETSFPTGVTASRTSQVRLVGSSPTTLDWFQKNTSYCCYYDYGYSQILTGLLTVSGYDSPMVYAIGRDVYGNHTAVLPQLAYKVLTDTMAVTVNQTESTCGGNVPANLQYYACYAGFSFHATRRGKMRVYARVDGLPTDSVDITFQW